MTTMLQIVKRWCRKNDVDLEAFHYECEGPDWVKVHEGFACEDKYYNLEEVVFRHVPTGRFVRCWEYSLPYGIEDYGHPDFDERDIAEVFPEEVTIVEFQTREEKQEGRPTCRRHRLWLDWEKDYPKSTS